MSAESRFEALGLTLPPAPTPKGVYKPAIIDGRHLYVSGHGPYLPDGGLIVGRVGKNLDGDAAKMAARQTGLAILATVRAAVGSLDRVERVLKVLGMVNAEPTFDRHPYVINGCSELFASVWGEEHGVGSRSAVGMGSLPEGIAVEIEALFLLRD